MRKAAETLDDLAMLFGVMQIKPAKRQVETARPVLRLHILCVRKGQIEEDAQILTHRLIMPAPDGFIGQKTRQRIRCIHVRRIAKAVARKLIQQQHQGEATFGTLQPAIQFPPCGSEMSVTETVVKITVEGGILIKPFVGASLLPEIDDLGCKFGGVVLHRVLPSVVRRPCDGRRVQRLLLKAQEPLRQAVELGAGLFHNLPLFRQLVRQFLYHLHLMRDRLL
ncbi:hypothetical protein AT6N2_C2463 [Agrobacterium tumefaciens]|nr:hypothetical protein AT6N2_C2463 [Agrobacterium tumefaciens]